MCIYLKFNIKSITSVQKRKKTTWLLVVCVMSSILASPACYYTCTAYRYICGLLISTPPAIYQLSNGIKDAQRNLRAPKKWHKNPLKEINKTLLQLFPNVHFQHGTQTFIIDGVNESSTLHIRFSQHDQTIRRKHIKRILLKI